MSDATPQQRTAAQTPQGQGSKHYVDHPRRTADARHRYVFEAMGIFEGCLALAYGKELEPNELLQVHLAEHWKKIAVHDSTWIGPLARTTNQGHSPNGRS